MYFCDLSTCPLVVPSKPTASFRPVYWELASRRLVCAVVVALAEGMALKDAQLLLDIREAGWALFIV